MSKFIFILVEGQTEETFINQLISPHLSAKEIYITPIVVKTKVIAGSTSEKGGYVTYATIRKHLMPLVHNPGATLVTTMFDYYGLPGDFPGKSDMPVDKSCFELVEHLEQAFKGDIGHPRFVPYLTLHDFEGLLFSSVEEIANIFPKPDKLKELQEIREAFASPEEINDSTETAPNKRLKRLFPEYQKVFHGSQIANRIGLERIRAACKHFDQWITQLENC